MPCAAGRGPGAQQMPGPRPSSFLSHQLEEGRLRGPAQRELGSPCGVGRPVRVGAPPPTLQLPQWDFPSLAETSSSATSYNSEFSKRLLSTYICECAPAGRLQPWPGPCLPPSPVLCPPTTTLVLPLSPPTFGITT